MNSQWYRIHQVLAQALAAYVAPLGWPFVDQPALPLDMGLFQGERAQQAVFLLARGDRLLDQPGQNPERRAARFVLGAVSLSAEALADADTLHFGARDAIKSRAFRAALNAVGDVYQLREVEIEPQLKDAMSTGCVLMSAYEVEYLQHYPSFA